MASGVSVQSAAVKGGIGCCKTAIHELQTASSGLQKAYKQAGANGWKDAKYAALGGIVEECCGALEKPVDELQQCMARLNKLLKAIGGYEDVNL